MKKYMIFIASLCLSLSTAAQELKFDIESKYLNEKRSIQVNLPNGYHSEKSHHYPTLYVLDGHMEEPVAAVQSFLSSKGHIPQMVRVLIPHNGNRSRDYSTLYDDSETINPGADNFLNFIEKEVMPLVEGKYRTDGFRMLSGHSKAGLFVFHSLMKKPQLFSARFAFSPSSHHTPFQSQMLRSFFLNTKEINGYFYSNVGGAEWYKIKDAFNNVKDIFQASAPKGLRYDFELHDVDGHQSTPFIGQHMAFKRLYAPTRPAERYKEMTIAQAISHFDTLSKEFGVKVQPRNRDLKSMQGYFVYAVPNIKGLSTVNGLLKHYYPEDISALANAKFYDIYLNHGASAATPSSFEHAPEERVMINTGYRLFDEKRYNDSIALFQLATHFYPNSSNAWDSLGEATEYAGQFEKAIEFYQKAIALAQEQHEDSRKIDRYLNHVERAKNTMSKTEV